MKATTRGIRIGAATLGAVVLSTVVGAAVATAEDKHGRDDVDVTVEIPAIDSPGVLALTVDGDSTTLTESGSTDLVRQFTGTMPTVTVTDTRSADEIPAGAYWYVLGTATNFTGDAGQVPISANYLGWKPRLIDADPGSVSAGDPVYSAVDDDQAPDNVGLVDEELFAMASDSGAIAAEGQWTATADLSLRTPATVADGTYTSTITLSLFE
ncbi:hypothetical protein AB0E00_24715 [Streptomyces sp. NPDC048110]|uniref:hypothetical protein n=1 Tax=Streptomyces sp. NPDC048110 TaxID=3155483 RepID=UPI0033F8C813